MNHQMGNASELDVLASLPQGNLFALGVDIVDREVGGLPNECRRTTRDGHHTLPFDAIGLPGKCPRTIAPAFDSHPPKVLRVG